VPITINHVQSSDKLPVSINAKSSRQIRLPPSIEIQLPRSGPQVVGIPYRKTLSMALEVILQTLKVRQKKPAASLSGHAVRACVRLKIDTIMHLAIKQRASDIYIELLESHTNMRFRVDGRLLQVCQVFQVASALHAPINSRIKIVSDLNMAEQKHRGIAV
jgi:type II secretory ATPase GspE/PulE/Tfp pilus assembly ATPase PilB-like protein